MRNKIIYSIIGLILISYSCLACNCHYTSDENKHIVSKNNADNEPINTVAIVSVLGILGSACGWLYNERQKRRMKLISAKEERYEWLIRQIRYLGEAAEGDKTKGNEFIVNFQLCWMYCPDEIIKKGNQFLDSIDPNKVGKIDQRETDRLKGEFILALRQDLLDMDKSIFSIERKSTKLTAEDYRDVVFKLK